MPGSAKERAASRDRDSPDPQLEAVRGVAEYCRDAVALTTSGVELDALQILYANAPFRAVAGIRSTGLAGRSISSLFPADIREREALLQAVAEGRSCAAALSVAGRDASDATWRLSPIRDARGVVVNWVCVLHQHDGNDGAERFWRERAEIAERSSAEKSLFHAVASHDLRQPLHAMELFVAAMGEIAADPRASEIMSDMRASVAAATRPLGLLEELSRLEAGTAVAERTAVAAGDLLWRLEEQFRSMARDNGIVLRIVQNSVVIIGDLQVVQHIMAEFVNAAVAQMTAGRIMLGCRCRGGRARLELWCDDPAMSARFSRCLKLKSAEGVADGATHVLGLGAAIAGRLATLLGYPISFVGSPDKAGGIAMEFETSKNGA